MPPMAGVTRLRVLFGRWDFWPQKGQDVNTQDHLLTRGDATHLLFGS